ncbi:ABC transporter ATP-binding protein [[Pseudopropionibacterium] massiliense]|uniref:ABC transporter ATP-binding protein n=1 Tax=[Pseudopropionibacterium] massiliense TaxID=2220000 RepID=UPI0010303ECC|nr:ABC transporter ATP-binding protein [[Pseudopropionibacterium] massiliense]
MSVLALEKVNYAYEKMARKLLENVTIEFEEGKFYAILGGSGAGKSTLLGLLAGLDVPTSGKILCNGKDISEEGLPKHRKRNVSLVFQNYNLIDYLTPLENLRLVNHRADAEVLERMGLEKEEINRNVMKLSGGQQQRVAIGRALVSDAPVILADEPTGNLDEDTAKDIIDILRTAAHDERKCVIVVTHSKQVARAADVVLRLRNRKLVA